MVFVVIDVMVAVIVVAVFVVDDDIVDVGVDVVVVVVVTVDDDIVDVDFWF